MIRCALESKKFRSELPVIVKFFLQVLFVGIQFVNRLTLDFDQFRDDLAKVHAIA